MMTIAIIQLLPFTRIKYRRRAGDVKTGAIPPQALLRVSVDNPQPGNQNKKTFPLSGLPDETGAVQKYGKRQTDRGHMLCGITG